MDLEVIMNEISQRKMNTMWFYLYAEYKVQKKQQLDENRLIDMESKLVIGWWEEVCGLGEKGEGVKYELVTKQSGWCRVQHRHYSQYY